MYVKTSCPNCKQQNYHDIAVDVLEHIKSHSDGSQSTTSVVVGAEVCETVSEEQLAQDALRELEGFVYDGITTKELCAILYKYFGVLHSHCCDLIQKMKIELDMYCPDRQHLYFVNA